MPRHNNTDAGVPFELLDAHTSEYVLAAKTTISSDGKSVVPDLVFSETNALAS